jgi:mRNA interferase MazF
MPQYSFEVLPFSYTDLTSEKRRPAIVLLDSDDGDILVARITSKRIDAPFDVVLESWNEVGLLVPSFCRLHKLIAIEKNDVVKKLGKVNKHDQERIKEIFGKIL